MNNEMNKDYLSWNEAFLALSKLISLRSKNKPHRTGSCIVDAKNRIMSLGYNGLPIGCDDHLFPSGKGDSVYDDKSTYVIPSIINAILLARRNLEGCTLYTTDFPCSDATKMIIQNGISKVYYIYDDAKDTDDHISAVKLLSACNIPCEQLDDLKVTCGEHDLISWDEAFIGLCKIVAMRSKDPNTQVGCCIVDDQHKIISLGYNGLPFGCDDKCFPWSRSASCASETKYPYIVHSEPNAISIAYSSYGRDLSNTRMYVTLFPCQTCAAKIIQAGIKEVLYVSDKYADTDETKAAKRMFEASGVKYHMIDDVDVTVNGYQKTIKR